MEFEIVPIQEEHIESYHACLDGKVVGWCDISISPWATLSHVGSLGMGIDSKFRGMRIGTALIQAVLEKSKEAGLEKVELGVFESNSHAIRLYEKAGFHPEGKLLKKTKLDGRYENMLLMGKLL